MARAIPWIVLALLTVPAGAQAWSAAGTTEPDTHADLVNGLMWGTTPLNASEDGRVYFDVYPAVYITSFNPNLGALGTRIHTPGLVHYQALLGVWLDCNRDGYIGLAESALREYRSSLLPADSPCPAKPFRGVPVHNDGNWVMELLTLGAPDPCTFRSSDDKAAHCPHVDPVFVQDPAVLYANGTLVWGDEGLPGAPDPASAPCPVFPLPRGTTAGTGSFVSYVDCTSKEQGGVSPVASMDAAGAVADPHDALGLRWGAGDPSRSSSRLNAHFPVNLYGDPVTGRNGLIEDDASQGPAWSVLDCTRGSSDPNDRALDPRVRDPTGSSWDAAAATFDAAAGDCEPTTSNTLDAQYPLVALESPTTPSGHKGSAFVYFTFNHGSRGTNVDLVDPLVGASTPPDGGLGYDRRMNNPARPESNGGPQWNANTNVATQPQLVGREDLAPSPRAFLSFYASLDPDVADRLFLHLPTGGPSTYGAEACTGGIADGIDDEAGWVCAPDRWYRDANGADIMPRSADGSVALAPRVGQSYQLADVDCDDGHVTGNVYASLVAIDGPTCSDP